MTEAHDELLALRRANCALEERAAALQAWLDALRGLASLREASTKTISDHILASVVRLTGSGYGFFGYVNADETIMTIHAWSGEAMQDCGLVDKPSHFPVSAAGVWAEAIRRREPFILNDYAAAHAAKKGLPLGHVPLTNLLVTPFLVHGKITAVAAVANRDAPYGPEDVAQVTAFLESVQTIVENKLAEEALRDSQERFRSIIQDAEAGYFRVGLDGRFEDVNPAWLRLHGYSAREQVIGQHFALTQVEGTLEQAQEVVQRLLQGAPIPRGEFSRRLPDGSIGYHTFSATPVWRGGQVVGLEGFLIDITERVEAERRRAHAEQELRDNERRYRALIEHSADAVSLLDTQGHVLYESPSYHRIMGYPEEERIGQSTFDLVHPADRGRLGALFAVLQDRPGQMSVPPTRVRHADGTWHWIEGIATNLLAEPAVRAIVINFRDITERVDEEARQARMEQALRDSEARYRSLVETQSEIISRSDAEGRLTFVNEAFCRTFGKSPEALRGQTFTGAVHPEDLAETLAVQRTLLTPPHRARMQNRQMTTQGWRWFSWDSAAILDERGQITELQGVGRDMTERVEAAQHRAQAEEALRVANVYNRSLIEASLDPLVTIGPDGKITDANQATEAVTGRRREDLIGTDLAGYFTEPARARAGYQQVFQEGQVRDVLLQIRRPDGGALPVLFNATVYRDAAGQVLGVFAAVHDISERQRIEDARVELERQMQQAQKAESLGRMAGAIAHHFNNLLGAIMGNLELIQGDLPRELDRPHTIGECLSDARDAARRAADVSRLMLTYLGQTPSQRESLDLAEVCRRSLALLRETLPRGVELLTDLAAGGPAIRSNAHQVHQILTNLLTNAWEALGPDGGAVQVRVRMVPGTEVLASAPWGVGMGAGACAAVAAGDTPVQNGNTPVQDGDATGVGAYGNTPVQNGNTPVLPGGVYPPEWQPQAALYACLEVTDSGCGITSEQMAMLCDPFYSSKFTGRGLGLPVVLGIVRAHHGVITVTSAVGRGSCFRVYLPAATAEQDALTGTLRTGEAGAQRRGDGVATRDAAPETAEGGVVLLVEDEATVRKVAHAILTRLGYSVLDARDGREALELFRQFQGAIRCVVTDLTMPGIDGWQTLAALRELAPGIPVVLASGYDRAEVLSGEHPQWPQAFLAKPYQAAEMRAAVDQALGRDRE